MSMVTAGLIMGGAKILGGLFGASAAKKREAAARREKQRLTRQLNSLENSRQAVINPYDNVKDLSSMAEDLSGNMTNPYATLGVATQAAEMQAEESDIALANTLDTLMASGASAGGATALAQAALKSKKGISASIESQEANNEKMRAQGQQNLEQRQTAETQRVQGLQISEGARAQEAMSRGRNIQFQAKENREQSKIDRVSAQLGGAQARQAQASADRTGAITGMIGGIASTVGNIAGAQMDASTAKNVAAINNNKPADY